LSRRQSLGVNQGDQHEYADDDTFKDVSDRQCRSPPIVGLYRGVDQVRNETNQVEKERDDEPNWRIELQMARIRPHVTQHERVTRGQHAKDDGLRGNHFGFSSK
jgi:hypothetical protein